MIKRLIFIRHVILFFVLFLSSIAVATAEQPSVFLGSNQIQERTNPAEVAQSLLDEMITWISLNFDLPSTTYRPAIEFASKARLTQMRIDDRTSWQGFAQVDGDAVSERGVVAVYDTSSKTIFLPEGWTGKSPAERSILVHELVHHLQNLAQQRFECPAAREKAAYLAQQKWLERFGVSLEEEFDLDMFTIVVSSACM